MKRQAGSLGSGQLLLLGLWSQQLGKGRVPTSLASCTQLNHHHEEFWYRKHSSKYCCEAKGCTGCKIGCTHQCSKEIRDVLDTVMMLLNVLCGCDLCVWLWYKYGFDYDHHVRSTLLKMVNTIRNGLIMGRLGRGGGRGPRQQKIKQRMNQAYGAKKMNQSTNQCSNNKPAGN